MNNYYGWIKDSCQTILEVPFNIIMCIIAVFITMYIQLGYDYKNNIKGKHRE